MWSMYSTYMYVYVTTLQKKLVKKGHQKVCLDGMIFFMPVFTFVSKTVVNFLMISL